MLTPEKIAANGSEHAHQAAFFASLPPLWHEYPELKFAHAIPNGGSRDAVVAGRLKAEGVRSGVWDVFVPAQRHGFAGLYLEFKKPIRRKEKRKGLSDAQWAFGMYAHSAGYKTAVVFTWEEALEACKEYLIKE